LQITAVSEDGFIEGIAISEKRFVQAVQWHPELLSDKASEKLFSALIQSFYTGSL
jgi:putative glutamine amidotransferase